MARPRSTYTAEFKLRAVKMVTDRKLSVAEAARQLDVGENLLREWRKASPRPAATPPSRGTATRPRPMTSCGGCGPRTPGCKAERDLLKKAAAYFASPPTLTFRFIADHAGEWPVGWMCDALEVSASGYYAWASRPDSPTRAVEATSWSGRSRRFTPR